MGKIPDIPEEYEANVRGNNLDLAYILPTVAACSAPTDRTIKKLYQNGLGTLCQVLNANHGSGNWTIMNLRTEKVGYDPEIIAKAGGRFDYRPYLDNNAVPLEEMLRTPKEMDTWLGQDPRRCIVVHCRHGKGRTGSIVVAYLMYKYGLSFDRANRLFTKRRKMYRNGVSVPSQVRYCGYLQECLEDPDLRQRYEAFVGAHPIITIDQITVHNSTCDPTTQQPRVHVQTFAERGSQLATLAELTGTGEVTRGTVKGTSDIVFNPPNLTSQSPDISVQLTLTYKGATVFMLWDWVNVAMEVARTKDDSTCGMSITIPWKSMDGYKGTRHRGYCMFDSVELSFTV